MLLWCMHRLFNEAQAGIVRHEACLLRARSHQLAVSYLCCFVESTGMTGTDRHRRSALKLLE